MTARKERSMELRIPDSRRHPLVFPHQQSHRTISRGSNSFAKHVIGIHTKCANTCNCAQKIPEYSFGQHSHLTSDHLFFKDILYLFPIVENCFPTRKYKCNKYFQSYDIKRIVYFCRLHIREQTPLQQVGDPSSTDTVHCPTISRSGQPDTWQVLLCFLVFPRRRGICCRSGSSRRRRREKLNVCVGNLNKGESHCQSLRAGESR